MTRPEKEKEIFFFVWCLTDNAVDHLAIRHRRERPLLAGTKTPKFTDKFDLKLGGKDRLWYNLTDQTYFGYNLTLYFDGFDFRGS